MAGTFGFKLAADDLLAEAWERCGLNPETLSDAHARSALRSLQLALVNWSNVGLQLWQVERVSAVLAAGVEAFPTPAGTTDVLEVVVRGAPGAGSMDTMLSPSGRSEWMALPDKAARGRPTSYWTERVLETPVLHLWPVPDLAYPLLYTRIRLPSDLAALSAAPDSPVLWQDALAGELAARLAVKFAPDRAAALQGLAGAAFSAAAAETRERVPLRIAPRIG